MTDATSDHYKALSPALPDGEFKMLEQKVEVKPEMNTPKLLCLMSSFVRQYIKAT